MYIMLNCLLSSLNQCDKEVWLKSGRKICPTVAKTVFARKWRILTPFQNCAKIWPICAKELCPQVSKMWKIAQSGHSQPFSSGFFNFDFWKSSHQMSKLSPRNRHPSVRRRRSKRRRRQRRRNRRSSPSSMSSTPSSSSLTSSCAKTSNVDTTQIWKMKNC